jgi:hypothetical protein
MTHFKDLYQEPEDERIRIIGERATEGSIVGVVLEKDEPAKVERYIQKVLDRYPAVCVIARNDGPTPRVVTIKFGRLK